MVPKTKISIGRAARREPSLSPTLHMCFLCVYSVRLPCLPPTVDHVCFCVSSQVEWLKSIGIEDIGYLLARHPHVLSASIPNLQAKHDFVTGVWGRKVVELEIFPQAFTYSLHYLRGRAGYLHLKGIAEKGGLHRLLRTPDKLFATKLAGGTIEEYQAFALAVKYGGGGAEDGGFGGVHYDPHAEKMRQPGGGGKAYDWGETSLDEMIEAFGGVPKLKPRGLTGMTHSELTAVEKFIAFNNERLERDRRLEEELNQTRRAVKAFLEDDGKELGEAEVTPVPSPDASSGDGDEGGPK